MHTISTENKLANSKFKIPNPKSQTPNLKKRSGFGHWNLRYWCLLGIWCLIISIFCGCTQRSTLEQAQEYLKQSQDYYQRAVDFYQGLIAKGKDLDRLRLGLGQVYYGRGEFKQAIEEFQKTNIPLAKKFLAISYYRLGNFTDALEAFNKNEILDDEYLYYYALTCEKLNLFDQAVDLYKKIKNKEFASLALERINIIEKQAALIETKGISPQVNKILANAPQEAEYPQAGALILYCDEKIEVTPQNSQVSYLHYIIKILNERGKQDFSEVHIDYDSTYEKIELEYARTLKPDGMVAEVGSRHIRDVSKYLNFPLYSNVRVYIISFPEITEGSSIEYKLKIYRNQLINKKDFVISYPLQASDPIIQANFSIDLPKEKTLHLKILNDQYDNFDAKLNPKIQEEDNRLIYSWEFKNIPQIIPEANMPASVQINPSVLISTFSSWQDIYDWWWGLAKNKIEADSTIKDKVTQLIRDQDSPEKKIMAIYNFCAKEIRYVAVEYGEAGYEPHNAPDIYKNRYGDCKDKAILLVTMLREAGISSWPVLIATKEYYNLNADFPAVLFNHCIVALAVENKLIFLDPTAETCSFGDLPADDQNRWVLVFQDDGYKIENTPLYAAEHNLLKQYLKMRVNPDETISVEKSTFTYGIYDQAQRFWLLYTPPQLIEEALKEKIQEVSIGARLDNYNLKNLEDLNTPVVLSYAFKGPEYFTVAGPLRIMPQLTGLDSSLVAKDKRKYAIDFNILDSKETIFEVELPPNFKIKYIPPSVNEDSSWLRFSAEYNYQNNKLYFSQKIDTKKTLISENEYADFKNFFEDLAKKIKQRIVLERLK